MPDPKLKEAMAEIRAILKKHDIGGAITLVSETHSEYLYELDPTWSLMYFESPGALRFRSNRKDFKTKKEQHRFTESSVHLLCQIQDLSVKSFGNMERILTLLKEKMDIDHTPFADHEPHREN